jgi:hypothetical protein
MSTSILSFQINAVRSPLVLTQMSPRFSLRFSILNPFLFGLTVPQQFICFLIKLSSKSGEEKKLSVHNLWPRPPTLLMRSVTVACVAVVLCVVSPFPNIPSCHKCTSQITQFENFDAKTLFLGGRGMYCLETTLRLKKNNDFVYCQMLRWIVIFYVSVIDHFKCVSHFS